MLIGKAVLCITQKERRSIRDESTRHIFQTGACYHDRKTQHSTW